jgi:hypothetical protein
LKVSRKLWLFPLVEEILREVKKEGVRNWTFHQHRRELSRSSAAYDRN